MLLRPDEGLFFANADALRNEICHLVDQAQPPAKVVILDLEMSNQLDVPSIDMLVELKDELEQRNAVLWLARLHGSVNDILEKSGALKKIGQENVHPRVLGGIIEYLLRETKGGSEDISMLNGGLMMTLEIVEKMLSNSDGKRREILESYHQKLTDILGEDGLGSNKPGS